MFLVMITVTWNFYLKVCHALATRATKIPVARRGTFLRFLDSIKETRMNRAQKIGRGTRGTLFSEKGVRGRKCVGWLENSRELCPCVATVHTFSSFISATLG
jgi:hypothetical protein